MATAESIVGAEFDGYRVEQLIGRGGMGAVYEAIDLGLNRKVAIKVLAETISRKPDSLKRFSREAKAVGSITHPNVANVHRVGKYGDFHYYSMEYIDGQSLDQLIRDKGRVGGARAFEMMVQAIRGLKAAADAGVIHRDIKPANLMVTKEGCVKIVDFGIAKVMDDTDSFQTATGAIMGTPAYMPPEMCRGQRVDLRSDMYSLGCTFYHMLTGRPPFDGETLLTVMERHITSPVPSITTYAPNVPDRLCNIIYTMMEKNPDNRYQTYEQLLTVIEAAKEGRSTILTAEVVDVSEEEKKEFDRRKLKKICVAAGLAAAAMIVWIAISASKPADSKPPEPNEGIYADRPEGGLSKTVETLRGISDLRNEIERDRKKSLDDKE